MKTIAPHESSNAQAEWIGMGQCGIMHDHAALFLEPSGSNFSMFFQPSGFTVGFNSQVYVLALWHRGPGHVLRGLRPAPTGRGRCGAQRLHLDVWSRTGRALADVEGGSWSWMLNGGFLWVFHGFYMVFQCLK